MNWTVTVICASLCFCLGCGAGALFWKWRTNRRLRRLSAALEPVMRGDYKTDWSPFTDGALGLLTSQLELTVRRTENAVAQLDLEKNAVREFIADISHQIKTPLAGLLSYLDLWEQTETDSQKRRQLESAIALTEKINELIRTLLELSRLESRSVPLNIREICADTLISRAVTAAAVARPAARVRIISNTDPKLSFRGDEKWLTQALVNLLVNAVDYSRGGSPVCISALSGEKNVILRVSNQGRLSEETLKNIFRRFYRASPDSEGFGLGLSIAKSIAELHKGTLRAENTDAGVTMILSLPQNDCSDSLDPP